MMSPLESDVFIAGAGPAGVAAAIHAAKAGFSVQVAEALLPPIDKACGEGLMPEAMAALERLGVSLSDTDSFAFRGIRFIGRRHRAEALFPLGEGRGIRRQTLSGLLIARAEALGVRFHWNCTVRALEPDGVRSTAGKHRARWYVAADGHHSVLRKLAGLDARRTSSRRIGLRQHFAVKPWTDFVEVHWAAGSQAYVTPVAPGEVCVAIVMRRKPRSFAEELREFPELHERLQAAPECDAVIGGATLQCAVKQVTRGNIALLGDASGAVDALTGEGLAVCFRQAEALVAAMTAGNLELYLRAHSEIARLPHFMSRSLLLLDRSPFLCERTLRAFARQPEIFTAMLRTHVGEQMPHLWGRDGIVNLGARVLFA